MEIHPGKHPCTWEHVACTGAPNLTEIPLGANDCAISIFYKFIHDFIEFLFICFHLFQFISSSYFALAFSAWSSSPSARWTCSPSSSEFSRRSLPEQLASRLLQARLRHPDPGVPTLVLGLLVLFFRSLVACRRPIQRSASIRAHWLTLIT